MLCVTLSLEWLTCPVTCAACCLFTEGRRVEPRQVPLREVLQFEKKCGKPARAIFGGIFRYCFRYTAQEWCHTNTFLATGVIAIISLALNLSSACYILASGIKITRKYQQLLYLDVVNALMELSFLNFIFHRYFITFPSRLICVVNLQFFSVSSLMFIAALISLSTDCVIAVLFPLKYRSIVTTKRTVIGNAVLLSFVFLSQFIFPLVAFARSPSGYTEDCLPTTLFPIAYILFSAALASVQLVTVFLLNITIVAGAIYALCRRRKMTAAAASVEKKMMKLVLRLFIILVVNIGMALPLLILSLDIKVLPYSLSYLLFVSLGIWNNGIYFFGDQQIRAKMLKTSRLLDICPNSKH